MNRADAISVPVELINERTVLVADEIVAIAARPHRFRIEAHRAGGGNRIKVAGVAVEVLSLLIDHQRRRKQLKRDRLGGNVRLEREDPEAVVVVRHRGSIAGAPIVDGDENTAPTGIGETGTKAAELIVRHRVAAAPSDRVGQSRLVESTAADGGTANVLNRRRSGREKEKQEGGCPHDSRKD